MPDGKCAMCGEVTYVAASIDFGGPICDKCDRELYESFKLTTEKKAR